MWPKILHVFYLWEVGTKKGIGIGDIDETVLEAVDKVGYQMAVDLDISFSRVIPIS
jgi:hypothetical protein